MQILDFNFRVPEPYFWQDPVLYSSQLDFDFADLNLPIYGEKIVQPSFHYMKLEEEILPENEEAFVFGVN